MFGTKPVKKPKYIKVIYIMSDIRDKYTFVENKDKSGLVLDLQKKIKV